MGIRDLLEIGWVYRAWQAPFADRKIAPVLAALKLSPGTRVLDVGCGPGTNARYFGGSRYVGTDLNPAYLADARRRYGMNFVAADAATEVLRTEFDVVLLNSLMHHLDDDAVHHTLGGVARLLSPGGRIHVLDLCLPARPGPARLLARLDRGDFPRPLDDWRRIFGEHFDSEHCEPYALTAMGVPLWHMVYLRGVRRRTT